MYLNLSTWIYQELSIADAMGKVRAQGFRSVEVSGDIWIHGWTWPEIVRQSTQHDIRIASVHCIHHTAREGLERSAVGHVEYHKHLYEMLATGGRNDLLVVEHVPAGPFEKVAEQAVTELGELVQLGQDFGLCVATENMPRGFASPDAIRCLLDNISGLLWTFDAAHAQLAGMDPLEFTTLFDDRLANVHVLDVHPTVRLGDWLPTGLGVIDWNAIIAALAASSYGGPLTVELSALQLREVLAVCDQVSAASGSEVADLQSLPWEDLFVQFARSNLLQTVSNNAVPLII